MTSLGRPKTQYARKEYPCDGICGDVIHKGERYSKGFAYSGYGHVETLRYCRKCTPDLWSR